ncbi:MAG: MFS transporter [Novosphingobium sp. 28-62-57]|uniref:peptide MFS transporter n=1 Tax=unclassified Novosphingobium TaxID=2644732 RepID=UPI000BCA79E1|nr:MULTISPECIES: peptide MFS transporter [unclassified Novosphingobium]OYW50284.1 MAG: MFS transporter [Novosphingobium sp. 12-62-10]OYZ11823.1 MAG: MFS transporter [Novosphingobium sp. 28-62-57]OZA35947.1 MAG: MFS transporter [Novosphingobium sp. 17-62-9]HQS68988.1 peptide MFS transporter [Novosphingobium sp.]
MAQESVNTSSGPTSGPASAAGEWFGHPAQLKRLFTTEMWERFGYYGMRAILTLYLAKHFLFNDSTSTGIYGGFTALVYLTPLIGGLLADRYLGSKRSVKFGAIMMAIGYFMLCFGGDAAKPYAVIEGQRYDVTITEVAGSEIRSLEMAGQRLEIVGNDDKSVSLKTADGTEAKRVAPGGFQSDGERSPFHIGILLIGLSLVTVGNGFFKPNISTIVGTLYADGDRRRDSGFTIFYMGINLGSLISQFFCPILAEAVGWWAGFGLAALGMTFSWLLFQFDGGRLDGYGERPAGADPRKDWLIYGVALVCVPLFFFLFINLMAYVPPEAGEGLVGYVLGLPIMGKMMFGTFLIAVPAILIWALSAGSRQEFQMMLAAMVLIVFNTVFWTLFEQAGSSLTLFAERNTVLEVGWTRPLFAMFRATPASYYIFFALLLGGLGWALTWFFGNGEAPESKRKMAMAFGLVMVAGFVGMVYARSLGFGNDPVYVMPAGQTQIFNALFIVTLAPLFSVMWNAMARRGVEPSIPVKFAIALMGVGGGFLLLVWGAQFADAQFKVGLVWLAGLYLIHSMAELCISPVGLSMITKLSMARIVGMMMGVWFLSIAVAQYVAGMVAQVASVETVGGQVTNLKVSLDTYVGVFTTIGWASVGIGALLLIVAIPLKKLMHGVT